MQYPLITDYKISVTIPASFDKLKHLEAVTDKQGSPLFAAGGPAVVFKMFDSRKNKYYALKCFLKHQPNRKEHFDTVSSYLKSHASTYLCNYDYLEDEIWINNQTYPVLLMDWVEGSMMSIYVAELCKANNQAAIDTLARKFDAMGLWLMENELAHCDIKPDNIIVTPSGNLKLVDYDGMYVPALKGKSSPELGTAEYRHPKRSSKDFGPHLDDFPILVLSLSLHCLAKSPALYDSGIDGDALLFRRDDYVSLLTCKHIPFFIKHQGDEVINARFGLLQYSLSQTVIELKSLPEVLAGTAYVYRELSTEEEDDDGEWFDSYGVKYSADRRKLLEAPELLNGEYHILDGTEMVCNNAFCGCSNLDSITLPDSVTTIGESAFEYCFSLESITLPDSVTTIGEGAFSYCSSLQSITIPDSVTTIGKHAFSSCSSLQSIYINGLNFLFRDGALYDLKNNRIICLLQNEHYSIKQFSIPDSVTTIGDSAFVFCHSLNSITIPDSVTTIGDGAFYGCNGLESITLPDSVTTIGEHAFSSCSSLQSIYINGLNFLFRDGALYDLKNNRIICLLQNEHYSIKQFSIPDSVTTIGESAFESCSSLESITLPDSVTTIGERAFSSCSSLESITLPDSVTTIGKRAFESCSSLQSITIPDSVTTIGKRAFEFCSSLESITLPDSVTTIGESAFESCCSLESITLPDSVTTIGKFAFYGCNGLRSITLPDSVTTIGKRAFESCSSLQSITLPDSVTTIGDSAFSGCSSLNSISIPDSVTTIGKRAFESCSSLQSITIPDSVTTIGKRAFESCSSLESITIPKGATKLKKLLIENDIKESLIKEV